MSHDPTSLESDLRNLRATPLDASFLDRLEACASETMKTLDVGELSFEHRLRNIRPSAMPAELLESLESKVGDTRFPKNGNILDFPLNETATPHRHRGWWSAAAAVALLGAASALLVPVKNHDIVRNPEPFTPGVIPNTGKFVPAGFNRGLSEASDQGVIWQPNKQAQRVLKVVYTERATFKDANGRTCEVEQPRLEYILVPTKTD